MHAASGCGSDTQRRARSSTAWPARRSALMLRATFSSVPQSLPDCGPPLLPVTRAARGSCARPSLTAPYRGTGSTCACCQHGEQPRQALGRAHESGLLRRAFRAQQCRDCGTLSRRPVRDILDERDEGGEAPQPEARLVAPAPPGATPEQPAQFRLQRRFRSGRGAQCGEPLAGQQPQPLEPLFLEAITAAGPGQ